MEKTGRGSDIVLLFDYYNVYSRNLHESFKNAGYDIPVVVISEEGFLPDDTVNVYEYFLKNAHEDNHDISKRKPRYFNQIDKPEYWEITGNNTEGAISDKGHERGKIFYSVPKNKRLVNIVDWKDETGIVRCSEHYNKQGFLYARTIFNKKGQKVNKSYFDEKGREVIVENYVTGDVILNHQNQVLIFKNKTDFVVYFMKIAGYDKRRVFFNSLSTPFFVSNQLPVMDEKQDILFWQEPTGESIPGNMSFIFEGKAPRCSRVIVQRQDSFDRLISLGVHRSKISKIGFIYSYVKENLGRPDALICTNTEKVEKLSELAEMLPEVTFHVTALTEMSAKLLSHEKYKNVRMYPNVSMTTLDRLFIQCDFFLDINHEGEIVDATRKAFMHNHLILAFSETSHGKEYTNPTNIFDIKDSASLANRIKSCLTDSKYLIACIDSQQKHALSAEKSDYDL